LDTNVWIFGLRRAPAFPACAQLVDRIAELHILIPRQVLRELQANVDEEELRDFFDVARRHPRRITLNWQTVPWELAQKYQTLGCKRGDAVLAAHVEHLAAPVLVSENRGLLADASGLPFRVLTAAATLTELDRASPTEET
jgi:predicted nucleic acid-binding protein